jgi:uncharacterized protein YutE (UPF0331/DUF86 family)
VVHREKLDRLLQILSDNLSDLRRYDATMSPDELARDRDRQHMVLHALYVATQALIDSAAHILTDRGLPRATTYAEVFHRLGEARVLPPELASRLADWASLRNVLAHFYPVIDLDRVAATLREDLGDLDAYLAIAWSLIDDQD